MSFIDISTYFGAICSCGRPSCSLGGIATSHKRGESFVELRT